MERKRLLFIYNSHAGKGSIRLKLADILDCFAKAGYEQMVYPTQKTGEAVELTKRLSGGFDLVVCSGGDGTLDEVVTGMMQCDERKTIGYIPAGSTNDFASSLHLPKNMLSAAQTIVSGVEFPCDVGKFNNDSFVYIAAFGMFTDVSYETKQDIKNLLGHMAYVLEGMKRLPMIPSYHIRVKNGEEEIEDDFMFGMITNSESVGGFKRITGKWVELDDGLFEVTLIRKPKNPIELNAILAALVIKDIDTKYMLCFKTERLILEAEEEIAWTLDGEFGGKHEKVMIENEKRAVKIMVPAQKK